MKMRFLLVLLVAGVLVAGSRSANAYVLFGPRWPDGRMPVPVCANAAGIPRDDNGGPLLTDAAFGDLVRQAFAAWQALPSSYVTIAYDGLCGSDPLNHADGVNTVGWASLPPGDEAGYTSVQSQGGDIVEADIVMSDGPVLQRYAGQMNYYRANVLPVALEHEAGHFLGLDHSPVGCALMNDSVFNTRLCQDDIDGLAALYPGPQRATSLAPVAFACGPDDRPDVTFGWEGSPEVDGYWLDLTLDPFFSSFLNWNLPPGTPAAIWNGLLPDVTHYWRLFNYNSFGAGYSYAQPLVTPRCYLGMPLPGEATGLNVTATCAADHTVSVNFTWNRVGAADGYWLDLTLDPFFGSFLNGWAGGPGNTSLTWNGLIPGTVHYWRVWSYNLFAGAHGYGVPFRTPDC